MKTYVITISKTFPKTHSRAGQETGFWQKIQNEIKKHTIRGNYKLWEKRFKKIQNGEACLSVRQWSDVAYQSKQIELIRLDKSHGIGIEKLEFEEVLFLPRIKGFELSPSIYTIAKNDGLAFPDFQEWFKKSDLSRPMAIIHFGNFRYNTQTP